MIGHLFGTASEPVPLTSLLEITESLGDDLLGESESGRVTCENATCDFAYAAQCE